MTNYMGLSLQSPIIAGSSGLMNDLQYLKQLEDAGIGAVVLKSIFEEQILIESGDSNNSGDGYTKQKSNFSKDSLLSQDHLYPEALGYISDYTQEHTLNSYLEHVSRVKEMLSIPVIASIHCVSSYNWGYFARRVQAAGADALELNAYILPSDFNCSGMENEQVYFNLVEHIKQQVTIPIALKVGYYFSSVARTLQQLSETGIASLVLFNRPYSPDIDIDNLELTDNDLYSNPDEYAHVLRWIAILSERVKCDMAASTGIHSFDTVVKQLLAGATAVQVASVLYKQGPQQIQIMIDGLKAWMNDHSFDNIDQFRGRLSQCNIENPAAFERVQFMKLYSQIE